MRTTITTLQITEAAIRWKNAVDVFNSVVMAYESGQIDRLQYNDESEETENEMDTAERALRELIEGYQDQQERSVSS